MEQEKSIHIKMVNYVLLKQIEKHAWYLAENPKRKETLYSFYSVDSKNKTIFFLPLFRKIKTRVPGMLHKNSIHDVLEEFKGINYVSLRQLLTNLSPKGKICKRQIPSQDFG